MRRLFLTFVALVAASVVMAAECVNGVRSLYVLQIPSCVKYCLQIRSHLQPQYSLSFCDLKKK